MTTLSLRRFGQLSLEELLAEAELLTRFDRKYLLDRSQASYLLGDLDSRTRVLVIDGRSWFHYESVYFDTPDLLSYRQAAQVRRHRFKVRTRSYLDSDLAFLEVKVRGDREITVKDRMSYDPASRDQLTELGRDYTEQTLGRRGLDGSVAQGLAPSLATRYQRATLVPPEPEVRVTIDTEPAWHLPHGSGREGRELRRPGLVIVETKSGARLSDVDRRLWSAGHRPVRISKYGTGLAALRSDLPSNKWARTLRRHFRATEELPLAA